ncbi:hypothetical protein HYH03_012072 [Edaphochlamys debaryana]|uniref:DNA2/NAM7 helicase-like C-terminal domain-containing protein n=1 Tax=Edaphochlamys debaryana TaxID=47281 RepID=A0A835XTK0_9CHLO|nr:hypothetical protein HYH03_012072 [Edaphochlamys debaryana]|eukprot:KAG2489435.1 hypothetical protein HYH03_012072 [Edaphochlamys debaryana]
MGSQQSTEGEPRAKADAQLDLTYEALKALSLSTSSGPGPTSSSGPGASRVQPVQPATRPAAPEPPPPHPRPSTPPASPPRRPPLPGMEPSASSSRHSRSLHHVPSAASVASTASASTWIPSASTSAAVSRSSSSALHASASAASLQPPPQPSTSLKTSAKQQQQAQKAVPPPKPSASLRSSAKPPQQQAQQQAEPRPPAPFTKLINSARPQQPPPQQAQQKQKKRGQAAAPPVPPPAPSSALVGSARARPAPAPPSSQQSQAAPAAAAGAQQRGAAGSARVLVDLWVPLDPPVLGMRRLAVRQLPYDKVRHADVAWLRGGWESADMAAAEESAGVAGAKPAAKRLPRVLGFDTEFIGDQLALLQLCAGDRALLIRVPPVRPTGGAKGAAAAGSAGADKGKAQGKGKGKADGGQGGAKVGKGAGGAGRAHPFVCPGDLKQILCEPAVPKAAAEAWQDALMVFAGFGVKLRGGLDLTVAVPPPDEEQTRGRKKLSLFDIFATFFPASTLAKDKTIDHSKWFVGTLSDEQVKYAALDAFVSYAAGVMVQRRDPETLPPPVDLSVPAHWEVVLAAQWVCVYQFLEAQSPRRSRHDFHQATFELAKGGKKELQLFVRMARFQTRLRRQMFVFIRVPNDDRPILGRCAEAKGKSAWVTKLRWAGPKGQDVKLHEVSEVREIEMDDPNETPEEEAIKKLIARVLCGQASLKEHGLVAGIFGGGSLALPPAGAVSERAQAKVAAALMADVQVNGPQRTAIEEVLYGSAAVTLVQGPPGTGKTTVISRVVELWLQHVAPSAPTVGPQRRAEAMACVARSNVAARNIALALIKRGLGPSDFRLVVSQEFHFEWHEEQYRGELEQVLIVSDKLHRSDMPRQLEEVKVFVTTTSMLTGVNFQQAALYGKVLTRLLVDEASQIYAGDMVLPLHVFGEHLRSLALFGDDMQLPPYGSEWDGATQPSPFDHLTPPAGRAAARLRPQPNAFSVGPDLCAGGGGVRRIMLEVSYRLPPSLCAFISQRMYGNQLQCGNPYGHTPYGAGGSAPREVEWVNVADGVEERKSGPSSSNPREAHAVLKVVRQSVLPTGLSWTVLTGYDLQRSVLDKLISSQPDLARHREGGGGGQGGGGGKQDCDRVYNIDTFQGREDCVVVVSCVKTGRSLGFMRDDRRVNVMLTRCTHRLIVVGSLDTALSEPDTLLCRLATHCVGRGLVRGA